MTSNTQERRSFPRLAGQKLEVTVRQRGQLARSSAAVMDFNRFGIALLAERAFTKDRQVFISLRLDELILDNVVGVVHNCHPHEGGYRCGIQFRTRSALQLDQNLVEAVLMRLECGLSDDALHPMAVVDEAGSR